MQDEQARDGLTAEVSHRLDEVAGRHGVSRDAALTLLRAFAAGGGSMAQFSHPELGGMGQWSRGGMIMVGDMFNQGLKARVDALCNDLAGLLDGGSPFAAAAGGPGQAQSQGGGMGFGQGSSWWPAELGSPASTGAQNDMRYAYFPGSRRLAIEQGGQLSLYDTGDYVINGVSQQQGGGGSQPIAFSGPSGPVPIDALRRVDAPPAGPVSAGPAASPPAAAPPPAEDTIAPGAFAPDPIAPGAAGSGSAGGDPVAMIERLAELHRKGVLTAPEFEAKKAELLRRL